MTDLGKGSKKGLTDGLREFIKIDKAGKLRKPKVPEGCPEVTVRENSEELTLRAEEVGTLKACNNVDHIAKRKMVSPFGRL